MENNKTEVEVIVNGKLQTWPKREYLDYKARLYGFDDYDDLKNQGYSLE